MDLKKLKTLTIVSLISGIITTLLSFAVIGIRVYIKFAFVGKTGLGVAGAALAWAAILLYISITYLAFWILINLPLYIFTFVKLNPYKENPQYIVSIIGFISPIFQVIALSLYIVKIKKLIKAQDLEQDNNTFSPENLN